jgi:hypothetical protein
MVVLLGMNRWCWRRLETVAGGTMVYWFLNSIFKIFWGAFPKRSENVPGLFSSLRRVCKIKFRTEEQDVALIISK